MCDGWVGGGGGEGEGGECWLEVGRMGSSINRTWLSPLCAGHGLNPQLYELAT